MAKTVWEEDVETQWPQYEGDLDAALASLREGDRRAVMLRFYEHKSFDEIATILGTAEEAARKRVSRAVEKLRGYFGVSTRTLPATAISYYLYNKLTVQAPLGLATKVTTAATAAQAAAAGAGASVSSELARHVVQHFAIAKVKLVATSIAAMVFVSVGAGVLVYSAMGNHTQTAAPRPTQGNFVDR